MLQDESSSAATDPEMERLEKQLQQSVDSLSTLLVEQKKGGRGGEGGDEKVEETIEEGEGEGEREREGGEEGEGEGGGEGEGEGGEEYEDSLSDGEDNQSEQEEGYILRKKLPGAVQVLPSISDQLSLLSPGSVEPASRELSPEALLEESLYSISKPIPITPSVGKTTQVSVDAQPSSAPTGPGISSTTSSPGTTDTQVQKQLPRSNSFDSGIRTDKQLMIPSSEPPWIEMVGGCGRGSEGCCKLCSKSRF